MIAAERAGYDANSLSSLGLRHKAMQEIRRLRRQLSGEVRHVLGSDQLETSLQAPDQSQARLLQQLLLAGSPYMVARRISKEEEDLDKSKKGGYRTGGMEQLVFIHNNSVLKHQVSRTIDQSESSCSDNQPIRMQSGWCIKTCLRLSPRS